MREMLIIAGPNGAGKTTAASWLLPLFKMTHFVNADEIARGLSPFSPESVSLEAGRIHLKRIDDMFARGESFALVIIRRFYKGLNNLFNIYLQIADVTFKIDNSQGVSKVIANFNGQVEDGWYCEDYQKLKFIEELSNAKQI